MKLATRRDGSRDGRLVVVRADGTAGVDSPLEWPTLQRALDDWDCAELPLRELARRLDAGDLTGDRIDNTGSAGVRSTPAMGVRRRIDPSHLAAPLPRAYEWVDGSAFLSHVILVRKARGAELPASLRTDPLVYQGGASGMLGPRDAVQLGDPQWGLDFESEICVVLGDTPRGTTAADAGACVRLVMLANDWTYRNLIPDELAKGFGFFCSKPATAFSPFAVSPDELGPAWRNGRVHLRVRSTYNGVVVGDCDSGPEMHFSFYDLIAHIAKTRRFAAGTIVGSGTVANADRARGISCLAERRMIEKIETGQATTPFMAAGDRIEIEALDANGISLFGTIDQRVTL